MAKKMSKENLKTLRSKIDKIDKDILKLIQKRAAIAVSIGKIKSKISPNTSFYKPDREATILRNILKANEDGALSNEKVRTIYKELISGCLSLEEALRISYLGPEGTHSEAAVHGHFGSLVSRIPSPTIDDVFHQVLKGEDILIDTKNTTNIHLRSYLKNLKHFFMVIKSFTLMDFIHL